MSHSMPFSSLPALGAGLVLLLAPAIAAHASSPAPREAGHTNTTAADPAAADSTTPGAVRVLLIGASIGKAWEFPGLPGRTGLDGIRCEYAGYKGFDKSSLVDAALARPEDRPGVVILKQCSAYFPASGNEASRELVKGWVARCRAAGVEPVLATVAPASEKKSPAVRAKLAVKTLLGKPTRNGEIARYNDWVREYARAEGLEVLDIERVVRLSEKKRVLDPDLSIGDSTHLNARAYQRLDEEGAALLKRLAARHRHAAAAPAS